MAVADPAHPILIHGRYRQIQRIASGGLGHVYLGWDEQLERRVAIKRLRKDMADMGETSETAWKEAKTLAALQHPNIVTLFDFGEDAHGAFYVMEFIEGETLDARLQQGVLDNETFLEIARQALEGVNAAHQCGILHRDLKPSNFMVRTLPNGGINLKILDFGLAKFQEAPSPQTMDGTNSIMGSVHYAAPEQFQAQPLDARTDLYSLGHVFYTCLAGAPAFQAPSLYEILNLHLHGTPTPLSDIRPDIDPWLIQWIHQLIQRNPADRPNNSQEALEMLYDWLRSQTGSVETTRSQPVAQPRPLQSSPATTPAKQGPGTGLWIGIGAAAALLAGGAFFFLTGSKQPPAAPAETAALPPAAPQPPAASAAPATSAPNFPAPGTSAALTPPPPPPAPTPAPLPGGIMQPQDLDGLRARIGQEVTVRGTPVDLSENRTQTIIYLNFAQNFRNALSLVFFKEDNPSEFTVPNLSQFVHQPIEVTGRIDEHRGNIQIKVTSLSQIRKL